MARTQKPCAFVPRFPRCGLFFRRLALVYISFVKKNDSQTYGGKRRDSAHDAELSRVHTHTHQLTDWWYDLLVSLSRRYASSFADASPTESVLLYWSRRSAAARALAFITAVFLLLISSLIASNRFPSVCIIVESSRWPTLSSNVAA